MNRYEPRPLVDPTETAYEALKDAENIGRDAQRRERKLHSYTGEDEDTARHVIETHVHVHHPAPSSPDVEVETAVEVGPVKVTGLPRAAVAAVVLGAALIAAVVAALAAHFGK